MSLSLWLLAAWVPVVVHPVKDPATHEMLRAVATEADPVVREMAADALAVIERERLKDESGGMTAETNAPRIPQMDTDGEAAGKDGVISDEEPNQPHRSGSDSPPPEGLGVGSLDRADLLGLERAVLATGLAGDQRAAKELLPLVAHEDEGLRQAACEALCELLKDTPLPAATQALAGQLEVEPSQRVMDRIGTALLAMHDHASRDTLLKLIGHERPVVRAQALRALGQWDDPELAVAIVPALKDEFTPAAVAAAVALGELDNPDAEPALLGALQDERDPVKAAAIDALGKLRSAAAVEVLMPIVMADNDTLGRTAAVALRRIGDRRAIPALRRLVEQVRYQQMTARVEAIRGLREFGVKGLAGPMFAIVTKKVVPPPPLAPEPSYDSEEARLGALAYLADTGDERIGEALLTGFKDTPPAAIRLALATTIATLTGRVYRPIPDESHRRYFVESLGPPPYRSMPAPPGVEQTAR